MTRAVVFIDGNNFYHNTQKEGLNPNKIDLRELSKFVSNAFNCEWKETIYYNSIPDITHDKEKYHSHLGFLNSLRYLPNFTVRTKKLQTPSDKTLEKKKNELIRNMDLCMECTSQIEEEYLKHLEDLTKKEKGIDVMIATDMMKKTLEDECERIILVTGDSQYVPILKLIEEQDKKPATSFVFEGYANELREEFDYHVLRKKDLKNECYYTRIEEE